MKKKLIAGGLILCTLALCACQTGKKQEKTEKAKTTAQTSTEAKVLSKYKEIGSTEPKRPCRSGNRPKGRRLPL